MAEKVTSPLDDPLNVLVIGILKGFTNSLWKVSGEGSGGVSRAFGADLWDLMNARSELIGETIDKTSPQTAMEGFRKFLLNVYMAADELEYEVTDDSLQMNVKNCQLHDYTDFLAENDVPRTAGCPYALTGIALMEDVTGEPFIIDRIESKDGNSQITLKKL